jgi:hypothetical protein
MFTSRRSSTLHRLYALSKYHLIFSTYSQHGSHSTVDSRLCLPFPPAPQSTTEKRQGSLRHTSVQCSPEWFCDKGIRGRTRPMFNRLRSTNFGRPVTERIHYRVFGIDAPRSILGGQYPSRPRGPSHNFLRFAFLCALDVNARVCIDL